MGAKPWVSFEGQSPTESSIAYLGDLFQDLDVFNLLSSISISNLKESIDGVPNPFDSISAHRT